MKAFVKISARNILKGRITEANKGATTPHIQVDTRGGATVVSSITNEATALWSMFYGYVSAAIEKIASG